MTERVDSASVHNALLEAQRLGLFKVTDPGLALFRACMAAGAPMPFTPGLKVLEVACCEADWLHPASDAWPDVSFIGVDWRAQKRVEERDGRLIRMQGDVRKPEMFEAESFDAVVSISAIEHIGLGHYNHDPLDADGDSVAVANIWRWLKPGGHFYFDVPYDPTGYRKVGTKCRVYDDAALLTRLKLHPIEGWLTDFTGYAIATCANKLVPKPTESVTPFHYCAMVWKKA